jgi:hypothetical protein
VVYPLTAQADLADGNGSNPGFLTTAAPGTGGPAGADPAAPATCPGHPR